MAPETTYGRYVVQEEPRLSKSRSRLPRSEARRRYITLGEEVLVEEMQREALSFDAAREGDAIVPPAPFDRLDANEVAARVDRTRGAISHLFGSQAAYQIAVMQLTLEDFVDAGGINDVAYPSPADFEDAESWIMAVASIEAQRGPRHGGQLPPGYATRWALWLGQVAYGIWSERLASPSAIEFAEWARRIERQLLGPALNHFGLETRPPITPIDLAIALGNLVEGLWLSQSQTENHPLDVPVPTEQAARNAFLMLWRGATQPK